MKEIMVNNRDGVLTVSSLQVASDFGKKHKHVLDAIENIKAENSAVTPMFIENTYQAGTGKNYKCYELTRDGFALLVMGFTGKEALDWKLRYIEAFNQMEQQLRNGQADLEAIIAKAVSAAVSETVRVLVPVLMQNQSIKQELPTSTVGSVPKRHRRRHRIIAQLEPFLQNEVDRMLLSERYTYKDVQIFLAEQGVSISLTAIGNYLQWLRDEREAY